MKRLTFLLVLPLIVFGLERVNLIKNHGFEGQGFLWSEIESAPDTCIANNQDSEKAFSGAYSGSCDTRTAINHSDSAVLAQAFTNLKKASDIDSFGLYYTYAVKASNKPLSAFMGIYVNRQTPEFKETGYFLKESSLTPTPPANVILLDIKDFPSDTNWYPLNEDIHGDLIRVGISLDAVIDSFVLICWGGFPPTWQGQKMYWDDIRLTGYADYDVGVKGILSRDSIGNAYTPTARIKNFGRKAADSFLVIASIEGGSGVVYADTLSWSLAADTEDTISFKEFMPSDAASYTLTVSTVMMPDESDEDDVMSKPLNGTGISEQPTPAGLVFNVSSFTSVPHVSYAILLGGQGTISLYDPSGRRVESLTVTGSGSISLKSNLSSGVYFVKLETGHSSIVRKAIILD